MKKDIIKELFNKEKRVIKIPITLKEFKELAVRVIKEQTGVDVSEVISITYCSETYQIYTIINEADLTAEQIEMLGGYDDIMDEYLNTNKIINDIFGITKYGVALFTDNNQIECAYDNEKKEEDIIAFFYIISEDYDKLKEEI